MNSQTKKIGILGGGPSGLFMYKRLIEADHKDFEIHIFEKKQQLGSGMPYSDEGANVEHITNVSDNEIPQIVTSIEEWIKTAPKNILDKFDIDQENFNEYKVLPRLFFGEYLSAQFQQLQTIGKTKGISTYLHLGVSVTDVIDYPDQKQVEIEIDETKKQLFNVVIICVGHNWPKKFEGIIPGYYDSPYPPKKLAFQVNHPVAIRGSSLTAIDAIRTLARQNGRFIKEGNCYTYKVAAKSKGFKLVMHSRSGLLPAVRFHLEDTHLRNANILTTEEITTHIQENNGFLSLDFIFEHNFKKIFREKDPEFYARIKDMSIEAFVESMMELRERLGAFQLFKAEYAEAEKSIRRRESVYWKEMLAVLSFAINYPAKHLSAEDMQRLQKVLMPLISIVIAFVPQSSARELLALYDAGVLDIVAVGDDSEVEPQKEGGIIYRHDDENGNTKAEHYQTFVDCVGQPHLSFKEFPFKSLIINETVSPAMLKFADVEVGNKAYAERKQHVYKTDDDNYYLIVPGININDNFQIVDKFGICNNRIYMMAVPYMGGYNPDYSGLDFSEAASKLIIEAMLKNDQDLC